MDLLSFARGPALQWSMAVCAFGLAWRLTGILLMPQKRDLSEPRSGAAWLGAWRMIARRMWPKPEFAAGSAASTTLGYLFHVGLFVVFFLAAPHVAFVEDLVGFSWPHLPNTVVTVAGAVTLAALLAMLVMRVASPVKRMLSNFDDYFSWLVTIAPVATGLAATAHVGGRYETVLALHILSAELLIAWLPFGKLMHAFLVFASRGATGYALARKGASI
jgi:nitrate reductase gamma subunit